MSSKRRSKGRGAARLWMLIGLAIVIAGILGAKVIAAEAPAEIRLPQEQLDRALAAGQPALAFYHLYDRSGEVQIYYGVPQADELRAALNELEGGG